MRVFRMSGSELNSSSNHSSGIETVGAAIRSGRESLSISREVLAQRLNMGFEQLEALEQGDSHRLPEPVFIKAMVRRLASHLKLDADALVAQLGTVSLHPSTVKTTAPPETNCDKTSGKPWIAILLSMVAFIGIGSWARLLMPTTTSPAISHRETNNYIAEAEIQPTAELPQEPIQTITAESTSASITLISSEPCWIALRRNGTVEFEGTLDTPRTVENPEGVEIYPGRPDLVSLHRAGDEPITLGSVNDLRWYPLNPER